MADEDDAPLAELPTYSTAELRHIARTEDVVHLDDLLMRRTSLAFSGAASRPRRPKIAEAIAPVARMGRRTRSRPRRAAGSRRVHAADPTWDEASSTAIA